MKANVAKLGLRLQIPKAKITHNKEACVSALDIKYTLGIPDGLNSGEASSLFFSNRLNKIRTDFISLQLHGYALAYLANLKLYGIYNQGILSDLILNKTYRNINAKINYLS